MNGGSYKQELVLRVFNRKLLGKKDILCMGQKQQLFTIQAFWSMGLNDSKIFRDGNYTFNVVM
jgi:hypothetical protein